jgi:hypothetical protein
MRRLSVAELDGLYQIMEEGRQLQERFLSGEISADDFTSENQRVEASLISAGVGLFPSVDALTQALMISRMPETKIREIIGGISGPARALEQKGLKPTYVIVPYGTASVGCYVVASTRDRPTAYD